MKIIIYQILVRLFGNRNTNNEFYGSIKKNGCGKFNDIDNTVLAELKNMGINHVWYTGVIEHATMTDYTAYGIRTDDPDVVKGRAGSPYAIKDYYNVDPDLATLPGNRMREFEDLVKRTHEHNIKVIIDFVPNHVARTYKSCSKPKDVKDLGDDDNVNVTFNKNNNFYYLPGKYFAPPQNYNAGGDNFFHPLKDGKFLEYPAKASGNDVFAASPDITDWFETVKLNYGFDFDTNTKHFDPIPDTWSKMLDILLFWAEKGVDGFRCDMCEMVPTEFWEYAITEVKKQYPHIIFVGEAYRLENSRIYISAGFDYLYDKSGLYDILRDTVTKNTGLHQLQYYLNDIVAGIEKNMVTFLENHDEQRFASPQFAGGTQKQIPLITLSATIHTSPVMIYFGQEVGATATGATGFSGNDGRTSIFDYTHVPEILQWANNGKYDGGLLSEEQKKLRDFYTILLRLCNTEDAIANGKFGNLFDCNANGKSAGFNQYMNFAFVRYTPANRLIVFVTVDSVNPDLYIKLSDELFNDMGLKSNTDYLVKDILGTDFSTIIKGENFISKECGAGLHIFTEKMSAMVLKITEHNAY